MIASILNHSMNNSQNITKLIAVKIKGRQAWLMMLTWKNFRVPTLSRTNFGHLSISVKAVSCWSRLAWSLQSQMKSQIV